MSDENTNVKEYLIPASDKQGHNVALPVRMPKEWIAHIDRIIKSHSAQYLTRGYFIRHAILRQFEYVEAEGVTFPNSPLRTILCTTEMLQEEYTQRKFDEMMQLLDDRVQTARKLHKPRRALKLVLTTLRQIDKMDEGDWKDIIRDAIMSKYGQLINNNDSVDFTQAEDDDTNTGEGE